MTIWHIIKKNFISNIKKNYIYIFAISFSVAMLFIFSSIYNCSKLVEQLTSTGAGTGKIIEIILFFAVIFLILFMSYAFNQYTNTRTKDYGILTILGIDKKQILVLILVEYLAISILSFIVGICVGSILSVLFFKALTIGNIIPDINYFMSREVCILVAVYFLGTLIFIALSNMFKISRKNDLTLLEQSISMPTSEAKYWFIGFIGLIIVGFAIAILFIGKYSYGKLLISMTLCIAGIYVINNYFGNTLIKLLKDNKKTYYKRILKYNEVYYRFKQNKKVVFMSFIMSFLVIYIIGGLIPSYIDMQRTDYYDERYPYDAIVVTKDEVPSSEQSRMIQKSSLELEVGYLIESVPIYKTARQYLRSFNKWEFRRDMNQLTWGVSNKQYNSISNSNVQLASGEILFIIQKENLIDQSLISEDEIWFELSNEYVKYNLKGMFYESIFGEVSDDLSYVVVFNDQDYLEVKNTCKEIYNISLLTFRGIMGEKVNELNLLEEHMRSYDSGAKIYNKGTNIQVANSQSLFVVIVFSFLGMLLTSCNCYIMYFKFIAESQTVINKYIFLFTLGMDKKEIKTYVGNEIKLIFSLPIIIACILSYMYLFAEIKVGIRSMDNTVIQELIMFGISYTAVVSIYVILQYIYYRMLKRNLVNLVLENLE